MTIIRIKGARLLSRLKFAAFENSTVAAALLSVFAPDPTFRMEKSVKWLQAHWERSSEKDVR